MSHDGKGGSGGAAMLGGANFQSRVFAYVAVHALAEEDATPVLGLRGPPVRILCEPQAEVDDLIVHATRGMAYVQAKRSVSFSTVPASPFGKAMKQFVTQFTREEFDPAADCLVLVAEKMSSRLTDHLSPIIRRLRTDPEGAPLTDIPTSQGQDKALTDLRALLDAIVEEDLGPELTEDDLREFLSRIELVELSFGDHGDGEREARNLLRRSVLTDPENTEIAWKLLVETGSRLGEERAAISQTELEALLQEAGLQLQSVRSVAGDIERLEEWTQRTLERLARFDHIVIGDQEHSLHRPYSEAVLQGADDGNLAVTGEPGAGKTGCLVETVRQARDEERPCVFLPADLVDVGTRGALRQALGLEHYLPDVLRGWRGREPGLLVIDGLDALRGGEAGRALIQLLEEVTRQVDGWNVVVSIREHDLRRGPSYWKLFPGEPVSTSAPPLPDVELANVRHLVIPTFTDDELARAREQFDAIGRVLDHASDDLRSLLRNPFNLDLAAGLVGAGISPEVVATIRSQTGLLDAWWNERVVAEGGGPAEERRHVLREGLAAMAGSRRLRAPRSAFRDTAASGQALTDLLSAHVLVEWQPLPSEPPDESLIAFQHHIVFDYAAARVFLAGTLKESLEDDPGLVVLLRPSIEMYFRRLWDRSSDRFWEEVLELSESDETHEISKAIGPSVAAESVEAADDLAPLLDALEAADENVRAAAANAFNHVAGAVFVREDDSISNRLETWSAFLERVSTSLSTRTAGRVLQLLQWALNLPDAGDSAEATVRLGRAARNLLNFCWTEDLANPRLGAAAIQLVARTYNTDPDASRELLEQVIAPDRLVTRGSDELWPLAEIVPQLWEANPEFVRNIYAAAFAHQETSEEPTPLGTPVVPLTSTRKQNFTMGQWKLMEEFSGFLEAAPLHAASAAVAVVEGPARDRWWSRVDEPEEHEFDFRGRRARIAVDQSLSWGQRTARPDEYALQIFEAFESHLVRLADSGDRAATAEILDVIAREARAAVVWARLLKLGAEKPDVIGRECAELLSAAPILVLSDTSHAACDLLEVLHPILEADERRRIEEAILSISREVGDKPELRNAIVERMIGHLDQEHIVTSTARRLAQELAESGEVPTNEPPVKITSFTRQWTEEDDLQERGVDVDDPANARLRELIAPVENFAQPNEVPSREDVIDVQPRLRALRDGLATAQRDGVHPEQASRGWGVLAAAVKRCSSCEELDCAEAAFAFVRDTALESATHEHPEASEPSDTWEQSPHWGSPVPRTEAAQAICWLAREPTCVDNQDLVEALRRLADDPSHVVRYQVACRLHFVVETRADVAWRIIDQRAREETSRGVLSGLLGAPLPYLARSEPGRVAELTSTILTRMDDSPGSEKVRERSAALLGELHVWRGVDRASQVIAEVVEDPGRYLVEAKTLAGHFREVLVSDHADGQPRERALGLLQQLVQSTRVEMERRLSENRELEGSKKEEFRGLMQILDSVGSVLFSISGALAARKDEPDDRDIQPTDADQRRLYHETETILEELSEVGIPRLAHNLVQVLEMFVPYDPRGVFLKLAAVIRGGERGGYQHDPMAEQTMVRLVERYLAEHRALVQRDAECESALIEILDAFLVAGSTEAQRLTRRLDAIYR